MSDATDSTAGYVVEGRSQPVVGAFHEQLGADGRKALIRVAMDMWNACIESTRPHVSNADGKIVFDKFHIAQHLGGAVGKVPRAKN